MKEAMTTPNALDALVREWRENAKLLNRGKYSLNAEREETLDECADELEKALAQHVLASEAAAYREDDGLEALHRDIGILLANLRALEEISGEELEDDDAQLVRDVEARYRTRKITAPSQSKEEK